MGEEGVLFMPYSEALLICPRMISPLNGRKTMRRNSTRKLQQLVRRTKEVGLPLTFTMPVPWPMRPSEAKPDLLDYLERCQHGNCEGKPKSVYTLLAYLALMQSSILSPLGFSTSSEDI